MATVEINPTSVETPSQQIIKAAQKTETILDARGRSITVRRMNPLSQMRLSAIAGPELSKNDIWMNYAFLASAISHFDGEQVSPPNSIREIEFMVERLDEEGLLAAGRAYKSAFGQSDSSSIETAKN